MIANFNFRFILNGVSEVMVFTIQKNKLWWKKVDKIKKMSVKSAMLMFFHVVFIVEHEAKVKIKRPIKNIGKKNSKPTKFLNLVSNSTA